MHQQPEPLAPLVVITFGGHVLALQRRTGQVIWQWNREDLRSCRLVFPTDRVLLAYHDDFVCLAYATGALLWRTPVPFAADAIIVDGDEIVFGGLGEVACVDTTTGALLWYHPFKGMGTSPVALGTPGNAAQYDSG